MPWIGPAIGVVGGLLSDSGDSGQQQQQTVSKDPWSAAAPWLKQNLLDGQTLQAQYTAQPFNAQQTQGYNNQFANADYMRNLTGSVLGQLNNSQYFDRSNPYAKPQTFQFPNPQQITAQPTYAQAPMPAQIAPQSAPVQAAPQMSAADAAFEQWLAGNGQWNAAVAGGPDVVKQQARSYYDTFYSPQGRAIGDGGTPSGGGY